MFWQFLQKCLVKRHLFNTLFGVTSKECQIDVVWSLGSSLWTNVIRLWHITLYPVINIFDMAPYSMMTSSNGNIFRVTGHLCGEFTGHRWIPHTKASDAELWCFYASAFRRRRHHVFGLSVRPSVRLSVPPSVRPSVRPKPEIPSFDLYIGPLVHLTNRYRFTACPSVRPSVCPSVRPSVRRGFRAFAGECMEGLAWNFTCWCILTIFRID